MKIDKEKCFGCEACFPYCPVRAIGPAQWRGSSVGEIDPEGCVECGVCLKSGVCPSEAIYMPELEWPRSIRAAFSNPVKTHSSVGEEGRGTEEMKTNDVTGRFPRGIVGVMVEMGRPGVGTTFRELQTVSLVLGKLGVQFEPNNPVTALMSDKSTGQIRDEVLDERVLSSIIEFKIEKGQLKEILRTLKDISGRIQTVFSLSMACRVNEDGSIPTVSIAEEAGFCVRPNAKTNVGLGRPLKEGA